MNMQFSATQIAALIQGTVEGDASVTVNSLGKIEEAEQMQLSFLANDKYEEFLYTTKASIVIVNQNLNLKKPVAATLIRVADAYLAFSLLLEKYDEQFTNQLTGVQQPSYVAPSVQIGNNVFIGVFACVNENVKLGKNTKIYSGVFLGNNVIVGDNSIIYPGVKIFHNCIIGNNAIIHAGAVIGSDGFGFASQADGSFKKIPQIGNVVIEDDVEIGANTTIDRATMGSTRIKKGTKLDNLIQVAHNVEIGNNSAIAAQSGISGSTKIGNNVMLGGQVGVAGHIQIGDGVKIAAQSGATKSIESGKTVSGTPAFEHTAELRSQAIKRKLPDLEKRIQELEELVKKLMAEKVQ